MRETCATVRVVAPVTEANPHGHITINEADLTADHVVFEPENANDSKDAAPKKPRSRKTEQPE